MLPDHFSQAWIDHVTRLFQPKVALYVVAIALALIAPQLAAALFLIIAVVDFIRTA